MRQPFAESGRVWLVVEEDRSVLRVLPDAGGAAQFDSAWDLARWNKDHHGSAVVFEYEPGEEGARSVTVYALVGDGLAMRLPLVESKDGAVCTSSVEVCRRDGKPLAQRDFGSLGLGALHREMASALNSEFAVRYLGEQWGAIRLPRPGRRRREDLFYARVALDYVSAMEAAPRSPVRWLAASAQEAGAHVTDDEIRARVRRARERKLLTPAPPGLPGGELTEKARTVLRAAGLLEEG